VFLRVHVEHELADRPMQPRQRSLHQRETRTGDLDRPVEIELPQFSADIYVILRRKAELARGADPACFDVIGSGLPRGNRRVRDVGKPQQKILLLRLKGFEMPLKVRELRVRLFRFAAQRGDVFSLGLRLTDALGELVARSLQLLRSNLDRLSLVLDRAESLNIEYQAAGREPLGDAVDIVS